MPNSPITGPCTDPHFADPGQTSPPTVGGVRRNASTAAECICPTAVCNRSIGREFRARPVGNLLRIPPNSGQVGPHKRSIRRKKPAHFGRLLLSEKPELICVRQADPGQFPNCTVLNHAELPPPLLSRRGQLHELFVTDLTHGNNRGARPVRQPPATAGMIETPAPSGVAVSRPCSKRTSSSFTYTFTNRRNLP